MKISVEHKYSGTEIKIIADNVNMTESISSSIYAKKEDGKTDYTKFLRDDIDDDAMKQFTTVMEDIAYYRESPYDSSSLIDSLFEKLPEDKQQELLKTLIEKYQEEEE